LDTPPDDRLGDLLESILTFRAERDWERFHTPKDVALSLTLEAGEVLEWMQWRHGEELAAHLEANREGVGEELSDVLYWTLLLAHDLGIDLAGAFRRKMERNAEKYPVEKSRGSHRKYTELAEDHPPGT